MFRCRVHRLLVVTVDVENNDIESSQTAHQAAAEIAKDIPESEWMVIDEWVEP
jgi:hypothetical protein